MASITQIRGALLEEVVLHLLEKVGYRIINSGEDGTRNGKAGLEVQGRGEWHQVDALAIFDYTPSFMYPLRLIVEAKCYYKERVQINVVRNSLGVLRDITENYFTYQSNNNDEVQIQRFNYHSAIFSTSGYTKGAQRYAIAHQIFLIQYQRVPLIRPVIDALLDLDIRHFNNINRKKNRVYVDFSRHPLKKLRETFRNMLRHTSEIHNYAIDEEDGISMNSFFTVEGKNLINKRILSELNNIQGSYYGMLQGKYPMHLLSNTELPNAPFRESDEILCRIHHRSNNTWSFVPRQYEEGDPNFFELQFDLPEEIANILQGIWDNPEAVANVKRERFSFLNIAGKIGGIQRQIRLRLDEEWLDNYIESVRMWQR